VRLDKLFYFIVFLKIEKRRLAIYKVGKKDRKNKFSKNEASKSLFFTLREEWFSLAVYLN